MNEPVKLASVYVPVKFLSEGIKFVNERQYLIVLGAPGVGKSTFLRQTGLKILEGATEVFPDTKIPVFVELKKFTDKNINLEAIKNHIIHQFSICGFPEPDKFTNQALEEGKLLILLDGLEEIPSSNFAEAINQIPEFVNKYHKNRFIISCRTAAYPAYRRGFQRFTSVVISDFNDNQIEQFIQKWFSLEAYNLAGTGEQCWELLQQPENSAAKELAKTPLLLTFLCLVYHHYSQKFENNRIELYKKALWILLEKSPIHQGITRSENYPNLSRYEEKTLLSEIAYKNFESRKPFFSQLDLILQIKTFLTNNSNIPQNDPDKILKAIVVETGILVEKEDDVYSFSHLTLQEYLTAQYINSHHQVDKLVIKHVTNKRWKEVFLLVAGLMESGADDLLLLMEKQVKQYINTPKLQALLNWAEKVTDGSQGNYTPVGKRAAAIAYAYVIANIYTIAHRLAHNIGDAYLEAHTYANIYANASAIANIDTDLTFSSYPKIYDIAKAYTNDKVSTISLASAIDKTNSIKDAIANTISHFRHLETLNIFTNINLTELIEKRQSKVTTELTSNKNSIEEHRTFVRETCQDLIEKFTEECFKVFNFTPDKVNDVSEVEDKSSTKNKDRFFRTPVIYRGKYTNSLNCGNPRKKLAEQDRDPSRLYPHQKQNSSELHLSLEEAKALGDYLYANHLIIQCKQAAVRVSPQTWETIEARMLLVSND
ncbi:MAG: NACHT domain-containing protein [Nostoc sp. CreGUA01]|nr:NACHT domain-containing protein [Nostoc sp. CreGUA01]